MLDGFPVKIGCLLFRVTIAGELANSILSFTTPFRLRDPNRLLDFVLAETLNGLTTHAGHDAAVDLLDRIEENARFHIDALTTDALATY